MRSFIEHIQKSIFGPEYYQDILTRPASYSWKYYWSFTMLLAVFMTIVFSLPLIPLTNKALREFPQRFFAYYPDDLEVHIAGGMVSTNAPEPYYFAIPEEWGVSEASSSGYQHLGVIDTTAVPSLEQFGTYHSVFWVTKNSIMVSEEGGVRITPFGNNTNFTVNEIVLRKWVGLVEPYFSLVPPLLVIAIFCAMFLWLIFNLAYLLFAALLVFFMGKLMKRNFTYGESYRIGLHATTLPLILSAALLLLPLSGVHLPFLPTILLLGVVYANFKDTIPALPAPEPNATEV